MFRFFIVCIAMCFAHVASAQEAPMTAERLVNIILAIDPEAQVTPAGVELTLEDIPVLVVFAPAADRMRVMVPIASAQDVSLQDLKRMMQANFDSALDARYAVAQDRVWGVYIHPLSPLQPAQFLSGVAQTVNLARTYGTVYSGGANVFNGGDSAGIYQDLFEDLLNRGQDI